jgi:hypothetical protein
MELSMSNVLFVAFLLLPIGIIGAAVWFHLNEEKHLRALSKELELEPLTVSTSTSWQGSAVSRRNLSPLALFAGALP